MNFKSALLTIVLGVWIYYGSYLYTCQYWQLCGDPPEQPVGQAGKQSTPSPENFKILYQNQVWGEADDFVRFRHSDSLPQISDTLRPLLDSLQTYLRQNPDKTLRITGYYERKERSPNNFPNLGLARAQAFWNFLNQKQILTQTPQFLAEADKGLGPLPNQTWAGGLAVHIIIETPADKKLDVENLPDADQAILEKSHTVYFDLASIAPQPDAEAQRFVLLAKEYLAGHPQARILITGHTDNTGTEDRNMKIGLQRAETLKQELQRVGIPAAKIVTQSAGQSQPLASNENEEGRQKNRRVVVEITD
ncbi:MAG: OmpA family protein [Microscillaceae bacterium]|nr:OmpA family protein [Microscillaceae bacterium]